MKFFEKKIKVQYRIANTKKVYSNNEINVLDISL